VKQVLFFLAEHNFGLTSLLVGQALSLKDDDDFKFVFLTGTSEKEVGLFNELDEHSISYKYIQGIEYHERFGFLVQQIRNLFLSIRPEFIHVQTNWQLCIVVFAKLLTLSNVKILYTVHGFRHNNKYKSFFARIIMSLALMFLVKRVIVCSDYTKSNFKILSYKIQKIYLGVDKGIFALKKHSDINPDGLIRLVFAGEFRHGKNQLLLVKTLSKLKNHYPHLKFKLTLPGDGPLKGEVILALDSLKLKEEVILPGFLPKSQIIRLVHMSDIAIIPTNSETFGLAIAEAFSLGLCVISRNVGVAPEVLVSGLNGFLFNKDSELYYVLEQLFANPELIGRCSENAYKQRDIFRWEAISNKYKLLLKDL
jgi:glycosyltransferase involved in cell wall biosynthesis